MYDGRRTATSHSADVRRTRRRETALVAQYIHQLSERPAGSRPLPAGRPRTVPPARQPEERPKTATPSGPEGGLRRA